MRSVGQYRRHRASLSASVCGQNAVFCHLSFLSSISDGGGSCELAAAPVAAASSSSSLRRRIRCLYLISARFTVMSVCPVSMSCSTRMMKSMNVSGAENTALMKVPLLSKYICRAKDSQCARQKSFILSAKNTSRPTCTINHVGTSQHKHGSV